MELLRRRTEWRVLTFAGGAFIFVALMISVRLQWVPLSSVDRGIAADLNSAIANHAGWVRVMRALSWMGSTGVLFWITGGAALVLAVRRRFRLAGYLVITSLGAPVLDYSLKLAVGRLRPAVADPVAVGGGNSFPSGHALSSSVIYSALLLVFMPAVPVRFRRPVVGAVGLLLVLIGFSRLALGVHFLSDVLGAWCLAAVWLGLTAYVFELSRDMSGKRVTEPLREGLEPEAPDDLAPVVKDPSRRRSAHLLRSAAIAVVGWVMTLGALLAIGLPLAHYRHGNGNILGDSTIPHWFAAHRTPALNRISEWGSTAGNTHMILFVGVLAGLLTLAVTRRLAPIVFLIVTMVGELLVFLATSAIVGRARPDVPHLDGKLPTSSFPSGHVAATTLLYASIAILVMARTKAWWRWIFVGLAVAMPLWVALSRMYRGMHHPTDILFGSLVLASLWLTTTLYATRPNEHAQEAAHPVARRRSQQLTQVGQA
ncbi:phosphatase PAP2 family protein [Actinoplanes sp. NPDC051411]|uniref:phosphatase PAP2 family protein n=1 Tax=Actinoplanes sp. NPDC051411 TaxID=3155522 RepID=UPI003418E06A